VRRVAVEDRARSARPEFNEGKEKDEDDDFATGIPGTAAVATVSNDAERESPIDCICTHIVKED